MLVRAGWQALCDLVFPPRCLVCHQPPLLSRDHFCDKCAKGLFRDDFSSCPRCAATIGQYAQCNLCHREPPPFDAAMRLTVYEGAMRDAILRLKNARHEVLAEALGQRWAELQADRFSSLPIDAIVPVPLHWTRRLWRGYNQAAGVAQGLAQRLRRPCRSYWLARVRRTLPQTRTTSPTHRRENLRGAFRARTRLNGLHILLVDDVMTTGATVSEAALVLKRAGASRVTVAVLARAGH